MILGRLIRSVRAEKFSIININWLTRAFVVGDILSFAVQGSSVGLSITGHNTGAKAVIIVGLLIQIVSFGLFGVTAAVFHRRITAFPTSESLNPNNMWRQSLQMLYASSALIMVRSIFRLIEYIAGQSGYLLQHEWTMYVFDSVPMLVVMIIFYVRYPNGIQNRESIKENGEQVLRLDDSLLHRTSQADYQPMR